MSRPKTLGCQKIIWVLWVLFALFVCDAGAKNFNRETVVVQAVDQVGPAVVNISSVYQVQRQHPFSSSNPFFDSFFRDFFDPGFERQYKRSSLGSGVIIDGQRGFILTNAHVIARSSKITITLKDEREFEARIIGADPDSDLAVLQIDAKNLPAVKMGDSSDLMIGETVIAIGNPFGFSHTVTTGVISAVNRMVRSEDAVYYDFIQTDASINPGNSGGPLLNINGALIGINTAIYAKAQGIGFAIPINKAQRIVTDLIKYGEVMEIWTGIIVQNLDARLAQYLRMPGSGGAIVRKVEDQSPARKAGIHEGDIITNVNKHKVQSMDDYHQIIRDYTPGATLRLQIFRKGKASTISFQAAVFPEKRAMSLGYNLLGVRVKDTDRGVVISEISRSSYLFSIGVRPGDIIRQLNEITVNKTADFKKAVIKYRSKNSIMLLLQRGSQQYYITVRL